MSVAAFFCLRLFFCVSIVLLGFCGWHVPLMKWWYGSQCRTAQPPETAQSPESLVWEAKRRCGRPDDDACPDVAKAYIDLGDAYGAAGEHLKHEQCALMALSIYQTIKGEGDYREYIGLARSSLGTAYFSQSLHKEAKEQWHEALELFSKSEYSGFLRAQVLNNLGAAAIAEHNRHEAQQYLEEALDLVWEQHQLVSPLHLAVLRNVGVSYDAALNRGNHHKFQNSLQLAVFLTKRLYGVDSPEFASSVCVFGAFFGYMLGDQHTQNYYFGIAEKLKGSTGPCSLGLPSVGTKIVNEDS